VTGARAEVVVLTGAGISADSGLATFRDAGGLWEGHSVEEVATPRAWAADPRLVWHFYQLRRASLSRVQPNAAHFALAKLARELASRGAGFTLVTQNVDDLHERAGSEPIHVHGELARLRCERCGARVRDLEHVDPGEFVPCSAGCREPMRPDVVWFHEMPMRLDEVEAALERCTHFAAVGTSGVVWPAAGWLSHVRSSGAWTSVLALEAPENLHPADEFRAGRAVDTVPGWCEDLLARVGP